MLPRHRILRLLRNDPVLIHVGRPAHVYEAVVILGALVISAALGVEGRALDEDQLALPHLVSLSPLTNMIQHYLDLLICKVLHGISPARTEYLILSLLKQSIIFTKLLHNLLPVPLASLPRPIIPRDVTHARLVIAHVVSDELVDVL